MTDWPEYQSHKRVRAAPIVDIVEVEGRLILKVQPYPNDPHRIVDFEPTEPNMARRAKTGDYAVMYDGGFRSISPRQVFDAGYTPVR